MGENDVGKELALVNRCVAVHRFKHRVDVVGDDVRADLKRKFLRKGHSMTLVLP